MNGHCAISHTNSIKEAKILFIFHWQRNIYPTKICTFHSRFFFHLLLFVCLLSTCFSLRYLNIRQAASQQSSIVISKYLDNNKPTKCIKRTQLFLLFFSFIVSKANWMWHIQHYCTEAFGSIIDMERRKKSFSSVRMNLVEFPHVDDFKYIISLCDRKKSNEKMKWKLVYIR